MFEVILLMTVTVQFLLTCEQYNDNTTEKWFVNEVIILDDNFLFFLASKMNKTYI